MLLFPLPELRYSACSAGDKWTKPRPAVISVSAEVLPCQRWNFKPYSVKSRKVVVIHGNRSAQGPESNASGCPMTNRWSGSNVELLGGTKKLAISARISWVSRFTVQGRRYNLQSFNDPGESRRNSSEDCGYWWESHSVRIKSGT